MASSTTPIPPMPGDWMACGACPGGSTARPRDATRPVSGGGTTTITPSERHRGCRGAAAEREIASPGFGASFPSHVPGRVRAAVRHERGADHPLVHVHVGDGRDADARRLDDADGVDADAGTNVARRCDVVPRHVDRDDGGHDAAVAGSDAVALSPSRRYDGRD